MKRYQTDQWTFLNMNSPADLHAEYMEEAVALKEYDGCRDGHALLSKFYLDSQELYFRTEVCDLGEGAAIGLYYGDGCFSCYCLFTADCNGITVRIPNHVPRGDTFRMEGPKRFYTPYQIDYPLQAPFEMAILKKNGVFSLFINDEAVLEHVSVPYSFAVQNQSARLLIKALNETDRCKAAQTVFGRYMLRGLKEATMLTGCMTENNVIAADVYVHIAGDFHKWGKTDTNGVFQIAELPYGEYNLICGKEGREFTSLKLHHDGSFRTYKLNFLPPEREAIPQENLQTDAVYQGLNGIWKFEFDKEEVGEAEKWYQKGKHKFTKCIRVPYSWQSLMAFGEEGLADAYTLHQANPFTCCAQEVGETGWYQRSFFWEEQAGFREGIELVFAAVSGVSKVWLDDRELGCILDSYNKTVFWLGTLDRQREYTITVMVRYQQRNDWACSGKQGFWFTDNPGIWQNVWLRKRGRTQMEELLVTNEQENNVDSRIHIEMLLAQVGIPVYQKNSLMQTSFRYDAAQSGYYKILIKYRSLLEKTTALWINHQQTETRIVFDAVPAGEFYDTQTVYLYLQEGAAELAFAGAAEGLEFREIIVEYLALDFYIELYLNQSKVGTAKPYVCQKSGGLKAELSHLIENTQYWSHKQPYQYDLTAKVSGQAETYRRKAAIRAVSTSNYVKINHHEIYILGVLDQGYNPYGIYTYRTLTSEAAGGVRFDISAARRCGYNLIRMHIKDNEPDWYHFCDEVGMYVWDEIPGNFYGTSKNPIWQSMYKRQLKRMAIKHNYHASVIIVSLINESWGISGDHEKSPWDDPLGQAYIKEYAKLYKEFKNNLLVIDNSGYGKTAETEIIDYHSYPDGFYDAKKFFERLSQQNYQGSVFNFYNQKNKVLMQEAGIRDLLQRTCAQDLKRMEYSGDECQNGQPVIVSEFVHTDRQEELIRTFPGIAGFVRMNLTAQENEDASPLTAERVWRDYGYVDEDMQPCSYRVINNEDLIYLDCPYLSQVNPGAQVRVPVYLSCWSEALAADKSFDIQWHFIGVDRGGRYQKLNLAGTIRGLIRRQEPYRCGAIEFKVPEGYQAGYLFAKLLCSEQVCAVNSVQFEIFDNITADAFVHRQMTEFLPEHITKAEGFSYSGIYQVENRKLFWGYGQGCVSYQMPIPELSYKRAVLSLELSDCFCLEGTRITDENIKNSRAAVYLQKQLVYEGSIKGQSNDLRALFSNSSVGIENTCKFSRTGRYGYGSRIEIALPEAVIRQLKNDLVLQLEVKALKQGLVIYGNRMGRCGINPMIEWY